MASRDDVELVRRGFEAFTAGDTEWLNEHLHENVVWHVPGNSPLAGDYRGREEVLSFFARSVQMALPELDVHDVAAGENHVVALINGRWRRGDGATFENRAVQVFHIEGGKALESWLMVEDQAGFDRFLQGASAQAG